MYSFSFVYPGVAAAFVGKGSLPLLVWVDYERVSLPWFVSINIQYNVFVVSWIKLIIL